jgi:DNA-binding LacI/PurR family transcriptional regulator
VTSRPKLQEVSDLAGVSLATVSRVLNAKPGVAGETRAKVLSVLADLGYQEIPVRPEQTGVVGIVTPEMDNPIFPLIAQTIESRLARQGMLSMICPATSDTVNEQEYLDHFASTNAAGIVVVNGRYADPDVGFSSYKRLLASGIPVVLVNGAQETDNVPLVTVDLEAGARIAVQHLVSMGHQRIGVMVGPQRYSSSRMLRTGYLDEMAHLGFDTSDEMTSETLFTLEGGRAGVAKLMEAGATGVVTGSDLMAIGAINGIRAWGKSVPGDVSVVGFDGTSLAAVTNPRLTSLRQPVERMAASVAWLLEGTNPDQANTVHTFQPELMIGRSTGRVRAHTEPEAVPGRNR